MIRFTSFVLTLCAAVPGAFAVTYTLPPEGSRLVGTPTIVTVPQGNTLPLEAFAAQHGLGLSNMLEANPGVDPFCLSPAPGWSFPSSSFCPTPSARGLS